jgi:dTDP-4-dehydrorhamnose 3,5-epimerase
VNCIPCDIPGLLVIEPKVFGDARGYFFELWNEAQYRAAGLDCRFVQDNLSRSRRGVLRGLHFQNPKAQAKLVSVLEGEVFDVAVDLRRGSSTFGRWHGLALSAESKRQFYIPAGFAHGFLVLSESALFHYKCTEFYSPADECTLRWDDPSIGIRWPLSDPSLSAKDLKGYNLKDLPADRMFP